MPCGSPRKVAVRNRRKHIAWMASISVGFFVLTACVTMPQVQDTLAPIMRNFSIESYSVLSGSLVLSLEAEDNRGIAGVEFWLDDTILARLPTAPYRYLWDTTGTTDGVHLLRAIATDFAGNESTIERVIAVHNLPGGRQPPFVLASASLDGQVFSESLSAQRGQTIYFRANAFDPDGGSIVVAQWNFADGSPSETGFLVSHAFRAVGAFVVEVTVTDDEGSTAHATANITIEAASGVPVITEFSVNPTSIHFTTSPVSIHAGATAFDPDGGSVTYEWDFGDGSPKENTPTAIHTYAQPGPNYRVSLTVRDEQGESASRTTFVTISTLPLLGMAPDFETLDEYGNTFRLSAQRGQVIMLNFWATWCIPCREEFPILQALHETYQTQGFLLAAVDTSDLTQPGQLRTWKQNNSAITYLLLLDKGEQYRDLYLLYHDQFNASAPLSMPYTALIDRGGGVRWTKAAKLQEGEADSLLTALIPVFSP